MTTSEIETPPRQELESRTTKTPCLILNRVEGSKYKSLSYANVNADYQEAETHMKICPSFPTRRAVFVIETTNFFNNKVERFIVEFYEFHPPTGWKFKKQYVERVFE